MRVEIGPKPAGDERYPRVAIERPGTYRVSTMVISKRGLVASTVVALAHAWVLGGCFTDPTPDSNTTTTDTSAATESSDDDDGSDGESEDGESSTDGPSPDLGSDGDETGFVPDCRVAREAQLTDTGFVSVSSTFDGFPKELAVDGDTATSWFSTGPEPGPSNFRWSSPETRCITRIELDGNTDHPEFAFDYGFETITLRILDVDSNVVYEHVHNAAGTPDPDMVVDIGGVEARIVEFELDGHEDPTCGGFAELRVFGG